MTKIDLENENPSEHGLIEFLKLLATPQVFTKHFFSSGVNVLEVRNNMTDQLRNNIIAFAGHVPDNIEVVLDYFKPLAKKRNELLLREGQVCKSVYYIVAGCLQVVVTDAQGKEATREFYVEDQWTTDIYGFQNQSPSTESIRCVEPCKLLEISHADFMNLSARLPQFAEIYRKILEISYNNTVYRLNTLNTMDGLERLRWLMENKPKMMSRLSSRLLASYIGLSAETMTRLKAKL